MKKKDFTRAFDEAKMPKDEKITRVPARLTMMLLRGFFIMMLLFMVVEIPKGNDKYVFSMTTALISMLSAAIGWNLKDLVEKKDRTKE